MKELGSSPVNKREEPFPACSYTKSRRRTNAIIRGRRITKKRFDFSLYRSRHMNTVLYIMYSNAVRSAAIYNPPTRGYFRFTRIDSVRRCDNRPCAACSDTPIFKHHLPTKGTSHMPSHSQCASVYAANDTGPVMSHLRHDDTLDNFNP